MRAAGRQFRMPLATVQYWIARAGEQDLDAVDWSTHRCGPHRPAGRTEEAVEDLVLTLRRDLEKTSALGECGAAAIRRALETRQSSPLPSVRTIGRILLRRGALDGRRRMRWPAPPRGWYLPDVAKGAVELDSFDVIEGLVIRGGLDVEILTGISLHGGLLAAWPDERVTAAAAVSRLVEHWRQVGLPAYAQFDNDTRFQGAHQHPDSVGRVSRLCLALGVAPVFAPPQETGFQAAIEALNGRWQTKVWSRFVHESREGLRQRSDAYVAAARARGAARIDAAPPRRAFPDGWALDLQAPLSGRLTYLRRTDAHGCVNLLAHHFLVNAQWSHRLVRAEVDLDGGSIRFWALRRRDPTHQPLLNEIVHRLPQRRFRE